MKFIKKNLKWITIAAIILLVITMLSLKFFLIKKSKQIEAEEVSVLEKELEPPESEPLETTIANVYVDIKGAVALPGVYEIEENKKVIDVVNLAGGFTEQADTSLVNLAKKVENEMVIIIYTSEEVKKATAEDSIAKVVDKQCICPEVKNDACIKSNTQSSSTSSTNETNTQKVNLNTATLEELQALSGIGESKAKAIIEYREKNGLFQTIEELMEVSGIGEALYEKVKNDIAV